MEVILTAPPENRFIIGVFPETSEEIAEWRTDLVTNLDFDESIQRCHSEFVQIAASLLKMV